MRIVNRDPIKAPQVETTPVVEEKVIPSPTIEEKPNKKKKIENKEEENAVPVVPVAEPEPAADEVITEE